MPPIGRALKFALVLAFAGLVVDADPSERLKNFKSPDGRLTAVVTPVGKHKGFEEAESRISILSSGSKDLLVHDFSSADSEHGYGVHRAQWTPDSQFFVCTMRNSGGHSPMHVPVVFWSRQNNRFYQLEGYTAFRTFSIAAPDRVSVDTWPEMNPATVSLRGVKRSEATELHRFLAGM